MSIDDTHRTVQQVQVNRLVSASFIVSGASILSTREHEVLVFLFLSFDTKKTLVILSTFFFSHCAQAIVAMPPLPDFQICGWPPIGPATWQARFPSSFAAEPFFLYDWSHRILYTQAPHQHMAMGNMRTRVQKSRRMSWV